MGFDYQIEVAVIGGDLRQLAVVEALIPIAQSVKVYGHSQMALPGNARGCNTLENALEGVNTVVLPIGGMNTAGMIPSYQTDQFIDFGRCFNFLAPGTLVLTGSMPVQWLEQAIKREMRVIQYAGDDTIAVLNSIPTAEGAVQIALEQLPITIHGSQVLIAGFGRVGMTVTRTFCGLGAHVTVAARRLEQLSRAKEMGCETTPHSRLALIVPQMQIIINTVPAVIFDQTILNCTAPEVLIIDLASAPGGIDYDLAKKLGRKAIFAPGLPGKVAPKTAGAILASAIPELIIKSLIAS